jgi:hypothetical protein
MFGRRAVDSVPGTHYRSDRLTAVNGQYFFTTREGTLEGPFFNRADAEGEIILYLRQQHQGAHVGSVREVKS